MNDTQTSAMGTVPPPQPTSPVPPFQPGSMGQTVQPADNAAPAVSFTPPSMPTAPMPQAPTPPPSPVPGSASWGGVSTMNNPAQPATPSWTPPPPPAPPISIPPMNNAGGTDFKPEEGKSKLPLLIAGILLILAMAGGYFLYMLYQMPVVDQTAPVVETMVEPTAVPSPTMTEEEAAQQDIEALEDVSASDEIEAIQEDVNNTDLSTLDQ